MLAEKNLQKKFDCASNYKVFQISGSINELHMGGILRKKVTVDLKASKEAFESVVILSMRKLMQQQGPGN